MEMKYRTIIFDKLKPSIFLVPFLAIAAYIFFGMDSFLNCIVGYIIGCLNFAILCLNLGFVVDTRFQGIRLIQPLLTIVRYGIVLLVLVLTVKMDRTSLISAVAGMTLVNMAAVFSGGKGLLMKKKEG